MSALNGVSAIVVGGSRGFGRSIVTKLSSNGAKVLAVGRDEEALKQVARETGAETVTGDARDGSLASRLLAEHTPNLLVLNAGVIGAMKPIDQQSWEEFSATWETDVKIALLWCQAAYRLPLPAGSHVVIVSSGAAMGGSPMAGGYSGAKRMQWLMANFFRNECNREGVDIRFTTVLPQLSGDTDLSRPAAIAYGERSGKTAEEFLGGLGAPFSADKMGSFMVELITSTAYQNAQTVSVNGDGLKIIEPQAA